VLCISPALADVEDTLTNLRYGARLLNISNKPVVNRVAVPAEAGDESEDVDLARWDRRWCGRLAAAHPPAREPKRRWRGSAVVIPHVGIALRFTSLVAVTTISLAVVDDRLLDDR
jgi:hypothetical protein